VKGPKSCCPHPVMREHTDDFLQYQLMSEFHCEPEFPDYVFPYIWSTGNPTLAGLISSSKAKALLHIECRTTSFRQAFELTKTAESVRVPIAFLDGYVEATLFVCASDRIDEYAPEGVHPDFSSEMFTLDQGDILAVGRTKGFELNSPAGGMESPVNWLRFECDEHRQDGPILMDLEDNIIQVYLPKTTHELYSDVYAGAAHKSIVATLFHVPVVCAALEKMRGTTEDELVDFAWYRAVKAGLEVASIDIQNTTKDTLEIAQVLLQNPYKRALTQIRTIWDNQ